MEALIFYLMGTIIGFASGVFKKLPNKEHTKGTIISLKQKQKNEGYYRPTFTAVVEYTVYNKVYTLETSYQTNTFRKGQTVTVCYDRNQPESSYMRTSIILYLITYLCYLTGTVMLISKVL